MEAFYQAKVTATCAGCGVQGDRKVETKKLHEVMSLPSPPGFRHFYDFEIDLCEKCTAAVQLVVGGIPLAGFRK